MQEIALPPVLSVRDLAGKLNVPVPRLMQELMKSGILAAMNERIDFDTAAVVSEDLGFKAVAEQKQDGLAPEQVQAAFDDAVKAGQDRERHKNEGQAYANDVIPRARGAASRLMEEATGYRQRIIVTAEGDASRFKQILTEYSKAPEVTRSRMYLETVQQVYANTSKVMIDAKGPGNLLYLPLDKLMQATAAVTAAPAAAEAAAVPAGRVPGPVTATPDAPPQTERSAPGDARGRGNLGSRERGER